MNTIAIILFFASLVLAGAHSNAEPTDLDAALAFIKCAQEAIITGIPEAGIPGHDPLIIAHNLTYNFTLGLSSVTVHLDNMVIEGIPWWNVTVAEEIITENSDIDNFKFVIYWPMMRFSADWAYEYETLLETTEKSGSLSVELDHVNFTMLWISTKPASDKEGTLDDFSLEVTTKEAQVKVTNLGLVGDVIDAVGGPAIANFLNANAFNSATNEQLKKRLIDEWVDKPERIAAINANCDK